MKQIGTRALWIVSQLAVYPHYVVPGVFIIKTYRERTYQQVPVQISLQLLENTSKM